ncbi:MAG: ACP S-malonyltransferase [candidate division Zixibacteria bacterium]|nr:ACP S-malonyltransferase [candidate division Zixibacteria bacterium]
MTTAFVFPGQGSAAVGMGATLFAAEPKVDEYFAKVSAVLGRDLKAITLAGPEEELVATENAQPAIFALAAACLDLFRERCPVAPDYAAGHSLGEYTALYAAGALSFDDAATLVCRRGQFIADACAEKPGTMAAVAGLEDAAVEEICGEATAAALVVPANYNMPGQVVVSGTEAGVARAGELARQRGGKFIPLKVSGAFHSPLVAAAAERMKEALRAFMINPPTGIFIANASGKAASQPEVIRDLLYKQIARPVRWSETMERMAAGDVEAVVEFGHGRVLTNMFKKVKSDAQIFNVSDEVSLASAADACRRFAL